MRESRLMLLQYLTGLGIIVLGALHFADLSFLGGGYTNALTFASVLGVYTSIGGLLELFLALLTFHVFNGFRRILLELHTGRFYDRAVLWSVLLAGAVTFIWGTRTVLVFLGVG